MTRLACLGLLLAFALPTPVLADSPPVDPWAERYERAAAYSSGKRGLSLLIHRAGKRELERYSNGHTAEKAHVLHSGTKSFSGLAAMIAVGEGKLTLDELASDTLTEWKADPLKSKIKVRHLLDLTSGLDPAGQQLRGPRTENKYAAALAVKALSEPGTVYRYGPSHFYAFGELLKRKLGGESPLAYLKRKLLDPIGLKVADWKHDKAGNPQLPAGAYLTAREWIKLGELLRNKGRWKGKALIRPELLAQCFRGSQANPSYGLTFWLNAPKGIDPVGAKQKGYGPKDVYFAAGFANQRLYVFPTQQLVVVRQGNNDRGWSDAEFIALLLGLDPPGEAFAEEGHQARVKAFAQRTVAKLDTNGDGKLALDELPERRKQRWSRFDRDSDGFLSAEELEPVVGFLLRRR